MGRILWLPDVLRDAGLPIVVHRGWETRGRSTFQPEWLVEHHTASNAASGNTPALGIVINGRHDVPGPLANYLTARDGTIHVVASGRANHAGTGRYPDGKSGNTYSIGNEAENNGIGEPWPARQKDHIERAAAAICRHMRWGANKVIGHKEYTSRKIDPTYSMTAHRTAVARLLAGGSKPPPTTPPEEDEEVTKLLHNKANGQTVAVNGILRLPVAGADIPLYKFLTGGQWSEVDQTTWDWFMRNTVDAQNINAAAWWSTVNSNSLKDISAALTKVSEVDVDVDALAGKISSGLSKSTAEELGRRLSNG